MKLFLLGFMGSGKTTIGKKLAEILKYDFFDLDNMIEEYTQLKIDEIFFSQGELYFRQIEKQELEKMIQKNNFILSVGGGTPCFNNNIQLMNGRGITIYLKLTAEEIFNRLINLPLAERKIRPLIAGKNEPELLSFIKELLEHREPFYNQSRIIVPNATNQIDKTIEVIINKISLYKFD